MALFAALKIIAEIRRASDLRAYAFHPKIRNRFGKNYIPRLSISLHSGWAIEGTIGSEEKLDATYLSPQIDIACKLSYQCDDYELPLLISEAYFRLLPEAIQSEMREIDRIIMSEIKEPLLLYTYEIGSGVAEAGEDHATGAIIPNEEGKDIDVEAYKMTNVDYLLQVDCDIHYFREKIGEISALYMDALREYIEGNWNYANSLFEQCLQIDTNDGPSKLLQKHLTAYNFTPPANWAGYRDIDEPLPVLITESPEEEKMEETPAVAPEEKKSEHVTTPKDLSQLEEMDHDEEDLLNNTPT